MVTLYQEARALLRNLAFRPKKRLGQHFLIREHTIEAILRLVDLREGDEIVEIGPGLGFLTRRLVQVAQKVWAVEVDSLLVDEIRSSPLGSHSALRLIHGDFLKLDLDECLPDRKVKLVANLPYNISTPILFRLFEQRDHFSSLVLMLQREVAARMAATPGTKAYGTLSVWCQIYGKITDKVPVAPEAFFPPPKVKSTVLKISLYPEPLAAKDDIPVLRELVRASFGHRRKTLGNALGGWLKTRRGDIDALLREQGIDPRRRGETLSVQEFIALTRALKPMLSADG